VVVGATRGVGYRVWAITTPVMTATTAIAAYMASACLFVLVGWSKLEGPPAIQWAAKFSHWGYAPGEFGIFAVRSL
jgi:hypothetical protein